MTTTQKTLNEMSVFDLSELLSDMYKEVHNVRPRGQQFFGSKEIMIAAILRLI